MSVNGFKWVKDISELNEAFTNSYNDESAEGYFLEVDVQYSEVFLNDLHFLPKTMTFGKVEKLLENLNDKEEDVIQIRNLKQALNLGLVLKKVQIVI